MSILTNFEAYLLTERRVAHNTFQAYQRDLQQCDSFLHTKHNKSLETATRDDIKEYLAYLKDELAITARSMARKISALKLFFIYAFEKAGVENIMEDFSAPKIEKKLPHFLTEDEIEILLNTAEQDTASTGMRNRVMLYLLYVTGMRISELVTLKIDDIYFDTSFIKIFGKGGKERLVPIPPMMLDLVRTYLAHKAQHENSAIKESPYLFACVYGGKVKSMSRQSFWIYLKALCKKAAIHRPISPHTLRHSLATHMLKNGTDLRSLQLILGHENVTTVQVYTHVEVTHLRDIYNKKHPRST